MLDEQPRYRPASSRIAVTAGAMALALALAAAPARAALLDDFENLADWSTSASDGVSVELAQDDGYRGMAMRLDFDFKGNAGYVIARKKTSQGELF